MVKVLINNGWQWTFLCQNCHSRLEATQEDLRRADRGWYVSCPICKTQNGVPEKKISPKLLEIVRGQG